MVQNFLFKTMDDLKQEVYCKVSPPENTKLRLLKPRRKYCQPEDTRGTCPNHATSGLVFYAQKPHPICYTSIIKKQNYRSQKARLVNLETFLELWTESLVD